MRFRSPWLYLVLIALAFGCPSLRAQDGFSGALLDLGRPQTLLRSTFGQRLVAADFDNDARLDGAVLLNTGEFGGRPQFRIKLHFTANQDRELTFESSETALAIAAPDINRDGFPDLVVEQVFTRKWLQVWLNDGHGKFLPARVDDFSPSEAPSNWRLPFERQAGFILALPFRSGNDHALQILGVLRSNSSSSQWRVRTQPSRFHCTSFSSLSSRKFSSLIRKSSCRSSSRLIEA